MKYKSLLPARTSHEAAFTIVELLVVVVVIAILAAVSIIAYNGVTVRAKESVLKSDLQSAATQLKIAYQETSAFPASSDDLRKSDGTNFQYTYSNVDGSFCVSATSVDLTGKAFYIDQGGSVQEGECPPPLMQNFTASQCSALPVYTGSNPEAIVSLVDLRGGDSRTYEVARLADDNCWMLTNLKLGSTTDTTLLTPSDTNVAQNFTLPQVGTESPDYDIPRVYGPVPGDSGEGNTNYGYLYNWPAATAGETRASKPGASGNAQYSICPAGWRLPSGTDNGDSAWLNAKMNNSAAIAPALNTGNGYWQNWQYTGPFKGVFSGSYYNSSFVSQGSGGYLWTSSPYKFAHILSDAQVISVFDYTASPVANTARNIGAAVRCILY